MDERLNDPDYSDTLSPEEEELFSALSAEDDLGVVIRTSTWVEYYLRELISLTIDKPDLITWESVSFQRLLEWGNAAGCLPADFRPVLGRYSAIRNTYAHAPTSEIPTVKLKAAIDSMNPAVRRTYKDIEEQGTYRDQGHTDEQVKLRTLSHPLYSTLYVHYYDERRVRQPTAEPNNEAADVTSPKQQ
jgi:hypothetical protein